ncbi:MAG: response regulator [Methylobacteriaceae bacterium]|nr:response regulator [Methylobacteriaceae bacterium]
MLQESKRLSGRRVLVVEDEYFIAADIVRTFRADGAEIIGPAGTVEDALELVHSTPRIDGAILDINLHGEMVYPVADALAKRSVPFIFATGYDKAAVPERHAGIKHCEKPVTPEAIARALYG